MEPLNPNQQSPLYFQREATEAILEQMEKFPLTAITAPMGYGKTVLIKNYLARKQIPVCWLALNRGDNSLKYFWEKIIREFRNVDKELSINLAPQGFPSSDEKLAAFFDLFLKSGFANQERYIVFDNYQCIHNPHIHDLIQFIAQEQIEGMHLLILTRNSIPGNFLECSVSKIMGVIRAQEFEFSAQEIRDFFTFNGCEISQEQADKAYLYSQGWITAIYLMMLNYQQTGEISIPGNLEKLVEATMYAQYDDKIRLFLMKLSVVDSFTAEAAAYITGQENAGVVLDKLISQNSFVKYNQKAHSYHIHPVFKTFLYRKLLSGSRDKVSVLTKRAGEYMLHHESRVRGLEMLYAGGDSEGILKFLKDQPFSVWKELEMEELIRYFTTLTEEIKITYYVTYLRFVLFIALDNRFELAQMLISDAMDLYRQSWLSRGDGDGQLRGEIHLIEAVCYAFNPHKALDCLRQADALLPKGSTISNKKISASLETISLLSIAYESPGELENATEVCEEIGERLIRLTGTYAFGAGELCRAEYHLWRGNLKEAEKLLYVALQKAQSMGQTSVALRCVYFLIRKLTFDGAYEKMQSLMQIQYQALVDSKDYDLMQLYNIFRCNIYASLGDRQSILAWKPTEEDLAKKLARKEPAWKYLAHANVAVSLQNWQEVICLCQKTKPHFTRNYKVMGLIYTNIFEAIATMHLYTADFGKIYLRTALEMALPDRIIIPFVINYENLADLLTLVKRDNEIEPAFIEEIIASSIQYQKGLQTIRKCMYPQEEKIEFTPREKEMISHLINCQSNKEIAYNMGVKIGTVKKMMYNIFQKLQVNCRSSAIKKIINCELEI